MSTDRLVYVVDDDDAMRDSLAFLLKSADVPVSTYESGDALLAAIEEGAAGCVITDVRMPGMSGIDLLKTLRQRNPRISVIVITGHGDVPLAVEAMKSGAIDFLEKPFDDELMLTRIRAALSEQESVQQNDAARAAIEQNLARLSTRERQVLDGLIAGHPNKIIAYDLGISPRTVEIYRANVMTKMGANSLSDLVRMALTGGVLESS
jgi:two-component system response regulator FixJ